MFSNKSLKNSLQLNVSIGSSQSRSESSSTTVVANGSEVKAGGDVNVTSTKKDINITGSNVEGKDVTLNAKENLNITASKNTNKTEQSSKSSSASVGVGIGIDGTKYSVSGSMSKGEVSANGTSYNESNIKAEKDLTFTSGNDTNIKGGKLSGEKVTGSVGGNLNIESKQDSNNYKESNKSVGVSVGLGSNKAVSGSASVGKIDSKYESVIEQSGIYAGKEGFDIRAEANTDLKGGIISSEAEKDKNKISTGTLTYEDIQNKADYKAGSIGINVDTSAGAEKKDAGVTPNIGVGAKDNAESVTKATVSEGEIEIRDKGKQKQDLKDLNRDTKNSLNKLGEIFDKTKVEERQELAGLFGELAYNQIHDIKASNEQKVLYHALVGSILEKISNGDYISGASSAAINKIVVKEIEKFAGEDPYLIQWLSAGLGAAVGSFCKNIQVAASITVSGTKNNLLRTDRIPKCIDVVVWPYKDNEEYQIPHIGLKIVYDDGNNEEIHFGNYSSAIALPIGRGTILDVNSTKYIDQALLKGNAYILDKITDINHLKKIVETANAYMLASEKVTIDDLRSSVIIAHNREDIDSVYMPNGEFSIYGIMNRNCLSFVKSVIGQSSAKVSSFKNKDFMRR